MSRAESRQTTTHSGSSGESGQPGKIGELKKNISGKSQG